MPRLRDSFVIPGAEVTSAAKSRPFRDPLDRLGLHVRAGRVLLDVDERRVADDLDRLGDAADDQREIDLQNLAQLEPDVGGLRRLESLEGRGSLIAAGPQRGEPVYALRIGDRGLDTGQRGAACLEYYPRENAAGAVADRALDRRPLLLRDRRPRQPQQQQRPPYVVGASRNAGGTPGSRG
jgi:hypothetical protein